MMRRQITGYTAVPMDVQLFRRQGAAPVAANSSGVLSEQRRHSMKYAHMYMFPEVRPAEWQHDKRYGMFSYGKREVMANKGAFRPTRYATHQNLWETDTRSDRNPHYRAYFNLNERLHTLLGRESHFEAAAPDRRETDSTWELNNDQRFLGLPTPAIVNIHKEDGWNSILYPRDAGSYRAHFGARRSNAKAIAADAEQTTKEEVVAWWERLQFLVNKHGDAVGDVSPGESRNIREIQQHFSNFEAAFLGEDYQDRHLTLYLEETRPKELEDLFGLFMQMETKLINPDYCPRCNLPYATTRFCGEGVPNSPFRQWRGRYAPHKPWGKEWFEVAVRRAEQLWYRSTEDPYFGREFHTQIQAESLLSVYCKTQSRGKANSFMQGLQGSLEFLTGRITITESMKAMYEKLLDETPHPHLPTGATTIEDGAQRYLGEANRVAFSPVRLRVDMELGKFRRWQKETGAIRLPPQGWQIRVNDLTIPKVDENTRAVNNWREVKKSIEESFLDAGLNEDSYTAEERREMAYLTQRLDSLIATRSAVKERADAAAAKLGKNGFKFPTALGYEVFDVSSTALKPFGMSHAESFSMQIHQYPDASKVTAVIGSDEMQLDVRQSATAVYGDFESGDLLRVQDRDSEPIDVVVLGVDKSGAPKSWELIAVNAKNTSDVIKLGTDVASIRSQWTKIEKLGTSICAPLFDKRTARESFDGSVVGVKDGRLWVQFFDGVATPLGTAEEKKKLIIKVAASIEQHRLLEPPSWNVPFRNDWSEERLADLKKAPWEREQWVSLIPNKYTPKPKRFGYTQNITQDDFVTKEYKDRLTSKQFHTKPEAFSIIPDRHDASVKFGGKNEFLATHGLPSVDRNELENGWDPVPPVPKVEILTVEQALRDISGRRPGNFVKTSTEKSSLKLDESWWKPLEYGWEHRNEEQSLLHSAEQKSTDPASLPFRGRVPALATTHGIGERIRMVAEDFAKGFDLGPDGQSATASTNYDALQFQSNRSETVGFGDILVDLFNKKLGVMNEYQWASEMANRANVNPKVLLLSLNEWRKKGKPPSLALVQTLKTYLADEIAAYNEGVPEGVPKLELLDNPGVWSHAATSSTGSVWADKDSHRAHMQYEADFPNTNVDVGDMGYLLSRYVQLQLRGVTDGTEDAFTRQHLVQQLTGKYNRAIASILGKDASAAASGGRESGVGNNMYPKRYVVLSNLSDTLRELGFPPGEVENLSNAIRRDFAPPTGTALADVKIQLIQLQAWKGPSARTNDVSGRDVAKGAVGGYNRGNRTSYGSQSVPELLEALATRSDGLALDFQYRAKENLQNDGLRANFAFAVEGVKTTTAEETAALFEQYCRGAWAPNSVDAKAIVLNILRKASNDTVIGEYFNLRSGAIVAGSPIKMPELESYYPFEFDNVKHERFETLQRFREWQMQIGEESRPQLRVLREQSSATCYGEGVDTIDFRPKEANFESLLKALTSKDASTKGIDAKIINLFANAQGSKAAALLDNIANKLLFRAFPLLPQYYAFCDTASKTLKASADVANRDNNQLSRILMAEANQTIEREFRQNSTRYWKKVMDTKGQLSDETGGGSGSGPRTQSNKYQTGGVNVAANERKQQNQRKAVASATGAAGGKSGGVSGLAGAARSGRQSSTLDRSKNKPGKK